MRASVALFVALLALATAGPVAAQSPPPDERAAAQAFADAAKRVLAAADEIDGDPDWVMDCRALTREPPERREVDAEFVVDALITRDLVGRLQGPVLRLRSELAQAQTADPALISGRAAVRRLGRAIAAFPPPVQDPCRAYEAYVRAGYPRATARAARAIAHRLEHLVTRGISRRIFAAAERMEALGVSREDAMAFMMLGE